MEWEKEFDKKVGYIFQGRNAMYGEATVEECEEDKKEVKGFIREIRAQAIKEGANKALDYILSKSEEAVPGLFYVTNQAIEEARIDTSTD